MESSDDNSTDTPVRSVEAEPSPTGTSDTGWVTARTPSTGFRTVVRSGDHVFVADEPSSAGGTDQGATPYDYLIGATAACTSMTLRMYAQRKGWPLEEAIVDVRTRTTHAADCAACVEDKAPTGLGTLERRIELRGPLTEEQRQRLLAIADRCPVKQALERGITVVNSA